MPDNSALKKKKRKQFEKSQQVYLSITYLHNDSFLEHFSKSPMWFSATLCISCWVLFSLEALNHKQKSRWIVVNHCTAQIQCLLLKHTQPQCTHSGGRGVGVAIWTQSVSASVFCTVQNTGRDTHTHIYTQTHCACSWSTDERGLQRKLSFQKVGEGRMIPVIASLTVKIATDAQGIF